MSYWINEWNLNKIRETGGDHFPVVYHQTEKYLSDQMGVFHGITNDGLLLIFACAVAFDLAPYGNSATTWKLEGLLQAPLLDCSDYCVLATRLFRKARPDAKVDIRMAGWDEHDPHQKRAVGNHAQLLVENAGVPLLLDPTVPLAAISSYSDLKAGKRVDGNFVKVLGERLDKIPKFAGLVQSAIIDGRFKDALPLYLRTEKEFAP